MSKLWEVDPETRAKLLDVQKQNGNNVCVDCNAPSPQWASPKFGIFMCLNCSGIHRGLGVHISFIRSVTMDSFKVSEIKRMQLGGNKPWQDFFDKHKDNQLEGKTFETATVKERYDSEVGEEWKERLSAKVEGRDYVPGVKSASVTASRSTSQAPTNRTLESVGNGTPLRSGSPALGAGPAPTKKAQNEAYFAQKGLENAARPDNLPPSQGGKFAGFGSEPASGQSADEADWLAEFGKDPMAGLTKGFGWLGKNVKTNVQKLAESDLSAQARQTAAQLAQNLQASSKTATESFSRFVEGATSPPTSPGPDPEKRDFWETFGEPPQGPEKEKKEFWDHFGEAPKPKPEKAEFWDSFGEAPKGPSKDKQDFWDAFADAGGKKSSAVGTSAMKNKQPSGKKDDDWNEW